MRLVESPYLDIPTGNLSYEDLKREWFDRNHVQAGRDYPGEWLAIGLKVERPGQIWSESKVGLVAHSPDYHKAAELAIRAGLSDAWFIQSPGRFGYRPTVENLVGSAA
ncbi:hypothetical protein HYW43_04930 [Candidatus Daviesbacteria bacterium]|nr:hypothetical protein [Candidatus Daviesbacteria bacterium]